MTKAIYLVFATSAAVTALAAGWQTGSSKSTESRKSNLSVNAQGAKTLSIDIPMGEVHLATGRVDAVSVRAVRSYRGPVSDAGRRWLTDSVLRTERKGDKVTIEDIPFGKRNEKVKGNFDAGLDLQITIPESMNVNLDVNCGTVDGRGRYGSLRGSVAAGSVRLSDVSCRGNLTFDVSAGELNVALASIPAGNSQLQASVGSLKINLPRNADVDVSAKTAVGKISGLPARKTKNSGGIDIGDERSARFGKGGAQITLEAGTGSIEVVGAGALTEARDDSIIVASEFDGGEVAYPDPHQFDAADKREMEKAIRDAEREVRRSAKAMNDSFEFEKLKPEIDRAIAEALRESAQSIEEARREVHEALAQSRKEIDDAELSESIQALVKNALDLALASADEALRTSKASIEQKAKSMKAKAKDKASPKAKG